MNGKYILLKRLFIDLNSGQLKHTVARDRTPAKMKIFNRKSKSLTAATIPRQEKEQ